MNIIIKSVIITASAILVHTITQSAHAAGVACVATHACSSLESGCTEISEGQAPNSCSFSRNLYYGTYYVSDCLTCASGYDRVSQNISIPGCIGTYEYHTCEKTCPTCSNCTSDTSWSAATTGYEKKTSRTCNCGNCIASTSYRCAAGYWGSSTNGTSGCTKCTTVDGAVGTSPADTKVQTGCYIASGTSFSNTSGSGTYAGNSYWCN